MKGKPSVFGFHLEPLRVLPVRPTLMFQLIFKQEGYFSLFNQALIFEVCQLYKTFSLIKTFLENDLVPRPLSLLFHIL